MSRCLDRISGRSLYPETPEEQRKRQASCIVIHEAVPVR